MTSGPVDDPGAQAAEAVRSGAAVPEAVIEATLLGECDVCEARFVYGDPDSGRGNLDPCPECGSQSWSKWGYRYPDGEEVSA